MLAYAFKLGRPCEPVASWLAATAVVTVLFWEPCVVFWIDTSPFYGPIGGE
jgi:hypothetical protein